MSATPDGGAATRRRQLTGRVIGVYASGGAPWHHLALAASHGASVRPVRAEDVAAGRLEALDALVVPGGGALAMGGLLAPLGETGATAVRTWVERGGTYVSSCAGSVLPLALDGEAATLLPGSRCLRMTDVTLANPGDATLGGLASPGVGRIEVRLDPAHPFAAGLPSRIPAVHYNGPLFDLASAGAQARAFAWPVGASDAFTPAERFLPGADDAPTTFERCVARGAATGVEVPVGAGRALLFGSHPEFGLGPLLLGWGDAAVLLVRALASSRARSRREPAVDDPGWTPLRTAPDDAAPALARRAATALLALGDRAAALGERDGGGWLDDDHAAAFHGRAARLAWGDDARAASLAAHVAADALRDLAPRLDPLDVGWLDDDPRPDQDVGAMGLLQLVARADAMLRRAEAALALPPERPAHAYDLFDRHPFHLAVGSYLSAAGLASAAALVVQVLAARHDLDHPSLARLLWLDGGPAPLGRSD